MRHSAGVLVGSLLAFVVSSAAREAPADDAPTIAQTWFDQLMGFDALEAYRLGSGRLAMEFAVARKWQSGEARIRITTLAPRDASTFREFLLLQNANGSDDYFSFPDFQGRVRQMRTPEFTFPLPYSGSALPIGELRPYLPGELTFSRLADGIVEGEQCRVVRGERATPWLYYDELELWISARTGVALRTRYLRGGKELRRVEVSPDDVVRYEDGRWLPARRRILSGDAVEAELVLRNLMIDPVLPDRLFTSHSLRYQLFPKF